MRKFALCLLTLIAVSAASISQTHAVGFQNLVVPDPTDKPLAVGVWYPSDAPVPASPNTPFGQAVALDGAVSGSGLPLIIISHGSGGWLDSHSDTALALAEAGFVVVAVTHTGDNSDDVSYPASRTMIDRPRHISRVLDYMLTRWDWHGRIDASRVGIFGYSAGALTALVAIGGTPDLKKAKAYCVTGPPEPVCQLGLASDFDTPTVASRPATAWTHDSRIKAAVIAAVGFGFAFDAKGLASVSIPVQLWEAGEDRNVPNASNTDIVRQSLPIAPEFHLVPRAGHYAFLPPCFPELQTTARQLWAMICVDPPGFDRVAFHREFNKDIVDFFGRRLAAH